jgi:hypothetical protein
LFLLMCKYRLTLFPLFFSSNVPFRRFLIGASLLLFLQSKSQWGHVESR